MVLIERMFINNEKSQLEEDKLRVNRSSPTFFPTPRLNEYEDEMSYDVLKKYFVPIKTEPETDDYEDNSNEYGENMDIPEEEVLVPFEDTLIKKEDFMVEFEDQNTNPPEPKRIKVEENPSSLLENTADESVRSTNELDAAVQSILN